MKSQRLFNPPIFFTVIIVAIILAMGAFLAILFVQSRPPGGTFQVTIEDMLVTVRLNPDQEVIILPGQGQGGEQVPPEQEIVAPPPPPTETPLPPPTETPIPPPPVSQVTFVNHQVSSGETLFSLANRYNTTIPLIARYGISSANLIPGHVVAIAVANPAYCPGRRAYVVREGDSAFGISRAAGISVEQFQQINNFAANHVLRFTDVVCLP